MIFSQLKRGVRQIMTRYNRGGGYKRLYKVINKQPWDLQQATYLGPSIVLGYIDKTSIRYIWAQLLTEYTFLIGTFQVLYNLLYFWDKMSHRLDLYKLVVKKKITSHNIKVKKTEENQNLDPGCNCTGVMGPCPLDGKCLASSVIYRAEVKDSNENIQTYTGLTAGPFKKRYYSHRNSFNNRNSEHSTTLSSHIWSLQDKQENFNINWKVIDRARVFNPINRRCGLCTKEKYYIIFQPDGATLNQRSELYSTCRHRLRKLLANI